MLVRVVIITFTTISLGVIVSSLAPQWNGIHLRLDDEKEPLPWLLETSDLSASAPSHAEHFLTLTVRGGSKASKNAIGKKTAISKVTSYWSNTFKSIKSRVSKVMKKPSFMKSKTEKRQEELIRKLTTTPVEKVTAPNSSLLPKEVIRISANRAGLIGKPLSGPGIQELASSIKKWYQRNGFVLHSVAGATLQADTKTAEISVVEPRNHQVPVDIVFCKEMIVDDDGSLLSLRQFKEKHSRRNTFGHDKIQRKDLNTTYIPTDVGRISRSTIAKVLGLSKGEHFKWNPSRFDAIRRSGIFRQILLFEPRSMSDGTVQFQIYGEEAPARNLEYGMSKSLYTGSWEGEIDFQHRNLFGGAESLGITVRRGTKDEEPSIRLNFRDDKFGMEGGYDVEAFSDYIGETLDDSELKGKDYDHDDLLDRKGLSFSLRNPIEMSRIQHSTARACVERTTTKGGRHEFVGSANLGLGPFRRDLPLDARSSVYGSMTVGSRVANLDESSNFGFDLIPYTTVSGKTTQVFPLSEVKGRSMTLALQHSVTTATKSIPRHEARALGITSKIRGYTESEQVTSVVVGKTELRVPVSVPNERFNLDGDVVLFGDWSYARKDFTSSFQNRRSVGLGLRKTFQGIPLKLDFSYNREGKISSVFGLGPDFDA